MRSDTSRNTWLNVSATECAPSARMAAEPEIAPATNFDTAIRRLAPAATMTVFLLSEAMPLPGPSRDIRTRAAPEGHRPGRAEAGSLDQGIPRCNPSKVAAVTPGP